MPENAVHGPPSHGSAAQSSRGDPYRKAVSWSMSTVLISHNVSQDCWPAPGNEAVSQITIIYVGREGEDMIHRSVPQKKDNMIQKLAHSGKISTHALLHH